MLAQDWPHASGQTLPIRVMCVDAGYATQDVYGWVRQHPQAGWGPAGSAAQTAAHRRGGQGPRPDTALLLSVSKADAGSRRRGLRVWSVGTPVAKGELYRWLKLEWPTDEALADGAGYPPGACHFPQYGDEYFKQLTAERLVTRIVKGFPRASWEKEPGRRNEALGLPGLCPRRRRHLRDRSLVRSPLARARTLPRTAGSSRAPPPGRAPNRSPLGHPGPPARSWLLDRREDWLSRGRHGPWLER